jgi:hypothetical protein
MELELENNVTGSTPKNTLKIHKNIQIWKLEDQNRFHSKQEKRQKL